MKKIAVFKKYHGYEGYAFIDKKAQSIVVQIDTDEGDISSEQSIDDKRDLEGAFKFTVDNYLKAKIRWAEEDRRYGK